MGNCIRVWICVLFFLMTLNLSFGSIPSWAEEVKATHYDNTESEEDTEDDGLSDEAVEEWLAIPTQGDTEDEGVEEQPVEAELDERVAKEKEWLRSEIRRIARLSNMSLAMKKTKTKELKDKLDLLKNSPEEYFRDNPQHSNNEDK
jgi:hypothetical protein